MTGHVCVCVCVHNNVHGLCATVSMYMTLCDHLSAAHQSTLSQCHACAERPTQAKHRQRLLRLSWNVHAYHAAVRHKTHTHTPRTSFTILPWKCSVLCYVEMRKTSATMLNVSCHMRHHLTLINLLLIYQLINSILSLIPF